MDPRGRWRDLEHGGKQYRTDKGAVVNWWNGSGKILFQGQGSAVSKFEQAFTAIASTKGRLENEDGKSLRDLERENETLRTRFSTHGRALSGSIQGHGSVPFASRARCSAIVRSAR